MDFWTWKNTGWLVVNLGVPVALPFLLLIPMAIADATPGRLLSLCRKAVEHGQMFWTTMAIIGATGYDAAAAIGAEKFKDSQAQLWFWFGVAILLALFCVVFITITTIHAADGKSANRATIVTSVLATGGMCIIHPIVHFRFA